MLVEIVPYKPEWAILYAHESQRIQAHIAPHIPFTIEHIGSTAVPNLGAKPIIDILIGLHNFESDNAHFVAKMQQLGYTYKQHYEQFMPYRRFFNLRDQITVFPHLNLSCNVHTVALHSEFWNRHLLFRNYLRLNPQVLQAYYQHKLTLAQRDWNDLGDYAEAKTAFIRQMEAEAQKYMEIDKTP
jgi:GrpB-like predicted nucleotidyltransferase (UPF0157 family)